MLRQNCCLYSPVFPAPSWSPTHVPRGRLPKRDRETNASQTFPPAVARKVPSSPCHDRSKSDGHCEGGDGDHTSVRDTIAFSTCTGHLLVSHHPTLDLTETSRRERCTRSGACDTQLITQSETPDAYPVRRATLRAMCLTLNAIQWAHLVPMSKHTHTQRHGGNSTSF